MAQNTRLDNTREAHPYPTNTAQGNTVHGNTVQRNTVQKNHLNGDPTLERITSLIKSVDNDLFADPLYNEALRGMQVGRWDEVSSKVNRLKQQYPNSKELDMLQREISLRTAFDDEWSSKVKGRTFIFSPLKLATRILPIALILAMLAGGIYYMQQTRAISGFANAQQERKEQAQEHMLAGRYQEASTLFTTILQDEPEDDIAQKGLAEATRQLALQSEYNSGLADFRVGEMASAARTLIGVVKEAPGYRDVDNLLEQIDLAMSAEEIFNAAESAYQDRQWATAIEQYEELKAVNSDYEAETVTAHLTESYLNSALAIVALSPEEGADVELAQSHFRKVLKLDINEPISKLNNEILTEYAKGNQVLASNDDRRAIEIFEKLNDENPGYLNGHITKQLFQLYMSQATRAEEIGDLLMAKSFYQKAASLDIADRSLAQQKLQVVSIALTPTATATNVPTPTPTIPPTPVPIPPTPVPIPPTPQPIQPAAQPVQPAVQPAQQPVQPVPQPPPTATAVPVTMASFHGWILFSSDRDGRTGLFVMQTNGADVQPAPAEAREKYVTLYQNEKWSPDKNAELIIPKEKTDGGSRHNVFKIRHDLPHNWTRKFRMTDFPGTTYDPVWDPTNSRIAFVSNHTGGDEIWVMGTEGQDHKQLTKNGWEWDKHPTWSVDGTQLFFYSNRTGKRQIWVMNPDGSGQQQLGNGEHEEWDPVVIR